MKPRHRNRRLLLIGAGAALLTGAGVLVASALQQNIAYFYTPSEAIAAGVTTQTRIRLGGLVETGSITNTNGSDTIFRVTDGAETITVSYAGILPDLFREGQGVITQGQFTADREFKAETILAKHDENYVPKELADVVNHGIDSDDD